MTIERRKSLCVVCGTRLSVITLSGRVEWKMTMVTEEEDGIGKIYCLKCYIEKIKKEVNEILYKSKKRKA